MAVLPKGHVVLARESGLVEAFDLNSSSIIWSQKTDSTIDGLISSANGSSVAGFSRAGQLATWSADSGTRQFTATTDGRQLYSAAFINDGSEIVAGGWEDISGWTIADGGKLHFVRDKRFLGARHVAPVPNSRQFVTIGIPVAYQLWKSGRLAGQVTLPIELKDKRVAGLAISDKARWLTIAFSDGNIILMDFKSGKLQKVFNAGRRAVNMKSYLSFSSDERELLIASGGRVVLLDIASGEIDELYSHLHANIAGAQFTPDGKKVVYVISFGAWGPQSIVVWDRTTRTKTENKL